MATTLHTEHDNYLVIQQLLGLVEPKFIPAIREGLPFTAYQALQQFLQIPSRALCDVLSVPLRTLARRKLSGRFLPEESDRLVRLARLVEMAVRTFEGDAGRARRWLTTPKTLLGKETPLEHADTEPGAREVEDMLYAVEFTMPA